MHLISIFFIVISFKISAQNYLGYYETINKAEIATLDKKFSESDSIYQLAFLLVKKPFKEDFLLAALNAEHLNDFEKTYNYLIKGIEQGLTLKRIKKELSPFKKSKQWKSIKKMYQELREKHLHSLNLRLREEVAKMIEKDQKARIPILGSNKRMKKTDNYNYNRLLEIIKENDNKWPGFSTIGEITPKGKYNVTDNITLLLLHFKKEQIEILKPYMLEAVFNGEMYPYHFARSIDYKNSCQIYGTYLDGGYMFKICDCEKAEAERKKIGFEPIADYYRKANSKYECIK